MKSINITVNNGQTHNLNKIYAVQTKVRGSKDKWETWKKFDNLQSAKQCTKDDLYLHNYSKVRIVKVNYIWQNTYIAYKNEETKKNWFTKIFRF